MVTEIYKKDIDCGSDALDVDADLKEIERVIARKNKNTASDRLISNSSDSDSNKKHRSMSFKSIIGSGVKKISKIIGVATKLTSSILGHGSKELFSIPGVIATVTALAKTPSFSGLSGLGKSAIVGIATSIGFSAGGVAGAIIGVVGGGVVGGAVDMLTFKYSNNRVRGTDTFGAALLIGAVVGGSAGAFLGTTKSYSYTRDTLIEKFDDTSDEAKASFNEVSARINEVFDMSSINEIKPKSNNLKLG